MTDIIVDAIIPKHIRSFTITGKTDEPELPPEVMDWIFKVCAQMILEGFTVQLKLNDQPMDVTMLKQTSEGNA